MTTPFGEPGPLVNVLRRPSAVSGPEDLRGVLATATLRRDAVPDPGPVLLLSHTTATAAFSRRDLLLPGHAAAEQAARDHGFEPVVRPVGGHLAAYDEGSLVLHLWGSHPDPRRGLSDRFRLVGEALARALGDLGVPDARVGAVPGEYCDGEWSVNTGGTAKLAGTGQRLFRRGYLFCAVLTVSRPEPLRAVLADAYATLDLPFAPSTVGSVDRWVPGVTLEEVREVVAAQLVAAVAASPELPAPCAAGAVLAQSASTS